MSKAIAGAVELAGAAVLALTPGLNVLFTPWLLETMFALAAGGIAMEAGAIAQALGSNAGLGVTTRTAAGLRQIIRGEQRVGGTTVYCSTTGSTKRQYNMVIVLATHPCESIVNLYLDGRQVYWSVGGSGVGDECNVTFPDGVNFGGNADGNTHYGPNGQAYNFGGEVFCEAFMGNQTSEPSVTDGVLNPTGGYCTALYANDNTWAPQAVPVGQTALAEAEMGDGDESGAEVVSLDLLDPGYGYADGTVGVTITAQSGDTGVGGGTAYGIASGGSITSLVVTEPGRYTLTPTVAIDYPTGYGDVTGPTTATPYLGGCTYVYLKIEADSGNFPQFPEIRFTVKGKNNVFDPRTSSTGYTTNWALHVADAITDSTWGLGDNTVNQDQLIAAANVCDESVGCAAGAESRYALNWHYDTSTAPGDALAQMMDAAAGRLSRIGGEWYIWPAYWQGPSFTFDANSLISGLSWSPKRSLADLCNRITGTYIAANFPYNVAGDLYDSNGYWNGQMQNNFPFAFQPTNYPMYACDTLHGYGTGVDVYLTQDGGIYLPKEVNQRCCLSISQAQRCAKIIMLRNRQQGTGTLSMNLAAWQMQPTDVMNFNMSSLSWTNKALEVAKIQFKEQKATEKDAVGYYVEVAVQETDPSVYEWNDEEELTPYDIPALVASGTSTYVVQPPTDIMITDDTSTALLTSDGTSVPRVLVTWVPPADTYVQNGGSIAIQYAFYSTAGTVNPIRPTGLTTPTLTIGGTPLYITDWVDAGTVSGQATYAYIDVISGYNAISVQLRSIRSNGAVSAWVEDSSTLIGSPIVISRPIPVLPTTVIPVATPTALGTVQPDNSTISITSDGIISVTGGFGVSVVQD